jgi:hypothetical protein
MYTKKVSKRFQVENPVPRAHYRRFFGPVQEEEKGTKKLPGYRFRGGY